MRFAGTVQQFGGLLHQYLSVADNLFELCLAFGFAFVQAGKHRIAVAAELLPQFLIRITGRYANRFPLLLQLFDLINGAAQVVLLNQCCGIIYQCLFGLQIAVVFGFQMAINGITGLLESFLSALMGITFYR